MKKIKLLTPILGITAISATLIPLSSCGAKEEVEKVIPEDAFVIKDVTLKGFKEDFDYKDYTKLVIPSSVKVIDENAFKGLFVETCKVSNIVIPGNVETIKTGAFADCSNVFVYDFSSFNVDQIHKLSVESGAFGTDIQKNGLYSYVKMNDEWTDVQKELLRTKLLAAGIPSYWLTKPTEGNCELTSSTEQTCVGDKGIHEFDILGQYDYSFKYYATITRVDGTDGVTAEVLNVDVDSSFKSIKVNTKMSTFGDHTLTDGDWVSYKLTILCNYENAQNGESTLQWVQSFDALKLTFETAHVKAITLDKNELTFDDYGKTYQLHYTFTPTEPTITDVTWTSSDPTIATVSDTGLVTSVKTGNATITVASVDNPNAKATCSVTVKDPVIYVTSITLNGGADKQLSKGEKDITLTTKVLPENATDKSVTWSSSDPTKVSINSETGKMEALDTTDSPVVITATAKDGSGVSGQCNVTVTPTVEKIKLNNCLDIDLEATPATNTISATVQTSNTEYLIDWEITEGTDVATIVGSTQTTSGQPITVQGNKLGVATLKASCGGKVAYCRISTGYESDVVADSQGNVYKEVEGLDKTSGNITGKNITGGADLNIARDQFNMPVIANKEDTTLPDNFLNGCTAFDSEVIIPAGVTQIGTKFLNGCTSFDQEVEIPNSVQKIGSDFMKGCTSFNQDVTIPSNVTYINSGFLQGCTAFSSKITIEEGLETIMSNFMYGCTAFNEKIILPASLNSIGNTFLYGCTSFNSEITLQEGITSIGSNFLQGCTSFDQDVTIPDSVNTLGGSFLFGCKSFNSNVNLSNAISLISSSFMKGCSSFNQPISIPDSVTTIYSEFMMDCTSFNQEIDLPDSLTTLGGSFLRNCKNFNNGSDGTTENPLTIPDTITAIEGCFLYNCSSFNQKINLPSGLKTIDYCFMQDCSSYNQPLTLPATLTTIGSGFLYRCTSFNQQLDLPDSIETIGDTFLIACSAFNNGSDGTTSKPFTFPSSLTSIGYYLFQNCKAFNQDIIFKSKLTKIGGYFLSGDTKFAKTIDFSAITTVTASSPTIGTKLLEGVSESNTIVFKVAAGTTATWTTILTAATEKATLPEKWTIVEA